METYLDLLPGDIQRLVEEYAAREIIVVNRGISYADYVKFDIVFTGAPTFTFPFIADERHLKRFTKYPQWKAVPSGGVECAGEFELEKIGDTMHIKVNQATITQLNSRVSGILYDKLKRFAKDVVV